MPLACGLRRWILLFNILPCSKLTIAANGLILFSAECNEFKIASHKVLLNTWLQYEKQIVLPFAARASFLSNHGTTNFFS